VLRHTLSTLSRSRRAERLLSASPLAARVAGRYVADDIGAAVHDLTDRNLLVTVAHLGPPVTDRAMADGAVRSWLTLLPGLPRGADVSVGLTSLGLRLSE
jgi:proline dehydrogenase